MENGPQGTLKSAPGGLKRAVFWALLFTFSGVASLVFIELILHIVPNDESSKGPRYVAHPRLGALLRPNQNVAYSKSCFNVKEITTNSRGFRDKERSLSKDRPRLAFIGDSMVEALQVKDTQVFNRLLENQFPNIEYLAFAKSGWGTVSEFVLYQDYVRDYHVDTVVLMFVSGNDLRNNVEKLELHYGANASPFATMTDGEVEIYFPPSTIPPSTIPSKGALSPVKTFMYDHLATYRFARSQYIKFRVRSKVAMPSRGEDGDRGYLFDGELLDYNIYVPYEDNHADWQEAWDITEALILKLRDAVEADGADFVLGVLFDQVYLSDEFDASTYPPEFDARYPSSRLVKFAERNSIKYLDFNRYFKQYKELKGLDAPYFWFSCDGHMSPLGHRVAAQLIAEEVVAPIVRND